MSENLSIPLHLAELLHVALGTLTDVLDGHPWVPLARPVVESYEQARDEALAGTAVTDAERMAVGVLEDMILLDTL